MKEITAPAFQAFDGKVFYSRKECQDYEGSSAARRLSGLTIAQVEAALSRSDPDLADAIEAAGMKIREARQKAGIFRKRGRKETAARAPTPPGPTPLSDGLSGTSGVAIEHGRAGVPA